MNTPTPISFSGHFSSGHPLGFEALIQARLAPPAPTQSIAGRRRIVDLNFPVTAAFEVYSGHFRPKLDLVIVMKNVAGVLMQVVVKFGDHRRWSELAARGVHAQPLWAARGGASGLLWPGSFAH